MLLGYGRRWGKFVERNRGVALILALLVLSFLTVLSGALLSTSTIDIWISDNYKNSTQSLYLAEAGIDHARELLRTSSQTLTQASTAAAGSDHQLQTADDQPLIASRPLIDGGGQDAGSYEVWLSSVDTDEVATIVSVARRGTARKTIEARIKRAGFPESDADPRLRTVEGLERLVEGGKDNATDIVAGGNVGDYGAPTNYRVMFAEGNVELGPGTGYGILVVRGELNIVGNIV